MAKDSIRERVGWTGGNETVEKSLIGRRRHARECERHGAEVDGEKAAAADGLVVVVALLLRLRQDADLGLAEGEALVGLCDMRSQGFFVRQVDLGLAGAEDGRENRTLGGVSDLLGGEDDSDVHFPQRLEPLLESPCEHWMFEKQPGLVEIGRA